MVERCPNYKKIQLTQTKGGKLLKGFEIHILVPIATVFTIVTTSIFAIIGCCNDGLFYPGNGNNAHVTFNDIYSVAEYGKLQSGRSKKDDPNIYQRFIKNQWR